MAFSFRRVFHSPLNGNEKNMGAENVFMGHLRRESLHSNNRGPMVKALREMHRMAGKQSFLARIFPRQSTIKIGNTSIARNQLKTIERMLAIDGFETTLMHVAAPHPVLADLFQDSAQYIEFVKQIPEKKWQNVLMPFAAHPNQQLRAMALLVFLQQARATTTK